jgi:hypothetical protein
MGALVQGGGEEVATCTGVQPTGPMTAGFWQPAALFLDAGNRKHSETVRMQQLTKAN